MFSASFTRILRVRKVRKSLLFSRFFIGFFQKDQGKEGQGISEAGGPEEGSKAVLLSHAQRILCH